MRTSFVAIYSTEISATDLALDTVPANNSKKSNIFSDAISVLVSLKNNKMTNPIKIKLLNGINNIWKNKHILLGTRVKLTSKEMASNRAANKSLDLRQTENTIHKLQTEYQQIYGEKKGRKSIGTLTQTKLP